MAQSPIRAISEKNTSMLISSRVAFLCVAGLASLIASWPASALDEKKQVAGASRSATYQNPQQALSKYIEGYKSGDGAGSLDALRYAADGGEPLARWKLGSMYAAGDGVPRDDARAYEYFDKIVSDYDDNIPGLRQRSVLASAFVAVGAYSLSGVPNSQIKRDPARAVEMFTVAATEFGDPSAQYNLGRMYLSGDGVRKDVFRGARWLRLAGDKQHMESQALLGSLYFNGAEGIQKQRALGLMYITLARDKVSDRKQQKWIVDLYDDVFAIASDTDRAAALVYLENFVSGRR
jgi:TPR repeat protein